MIKFVYCVRRRPDISLEEFRKYWLEKHGPFVRSFAEIMGARRYVQSHTLDSPLNEAARLPRGTAEPYDGITEIWWDNADVLISALQRPEFNEANRKLAEDEGQFVDLERSSVFFTQEYTIFER